MDAYRLEPVLIVEPDVPFSRIAAALGTLGWEPSANIAPASPPLVPGEPELAGWHWRAGGAAGKPLVTYTFNPVVRLRVLDVGTVPPPLRAALAARLPLVAPGGVEPLLGAADPRDRLRGLWIAGEAERIDLAPAVRRLAEDREALVAKVAAEVGARLGRVYEARVGVLAQLRLLAEAAEPLIRRLDDAAVVTALRPTLEDCGRLFDAALAAPVHAAYSELWRRPPTVSPGDRYPALTVTAAAAGLLRAPSELSDAFPRGYRNIAGWMNPGRIWLTWAFAQAAPTGDDAPPVPAGVRYDGLVWVETRWVWLPKVFRVVQPLLAAGATGAAASDSADPPGIVH